MKSLTKPEGQSRNRKVVKLPKVGKSISLGRPSDVSSGESNAIRDITIDNIYDEYKNVNIDKKKFNGLLALLHSHGFGKRGRGGNSACPPQDVYVNYIFEYDIQNQVFNSSFQDAKSAVVQGLQQLIAEWTAEEICKRNLLAYVTDEARLTKIVDVSQENNNRATLRFYISINVSKNLIPVLRRILESVCKRLQNERFQTPNEKVDWGKMVLIPIEK